MTSRATPGQRRSPGSRGSAPGSIDPLRRQDSNLNHWNQNPRCCRYTTADRPGIISLLRAGRRTLFTRGAGGAGRACRFAGRAGLFRKVALPALIGAPALPPRVVWVRTTPRRCGGGFVV